MAVAVVAAQQQLHGGRSRAAVTAQEAQQAAPAAAGTAATKVAVWLHLGAVLAGLAVAQY